MNLFYCPSDPVPMVKPVDRLLACLSHMITSPTDAFDTFHRIKFTKKRDSQVMERLWQLQALFLATKLNRPFLETGHEMVFRVKEQREQAARESDKKKKVV